MLNIVMQQVHPEIIAGWAAARIVDNGFAGGNWPLVGEIQTALEEYRDRHSDDVDTVRAVLVSVQERLAAVLDQEKEAIIAEIAALEADREEKRRRVGQLGAEIDTLLGREG